MLASALNPSGLAVDCTSVYWTDWDGSAGTVMKVPIDGGTPTTVAGVSAAEIAVDGTSAYWTGGTAVMKVALGGGMPIVLASFPEIEATIAVDRTSVYFVAIGSSSAALMKVGLSGGKATKLADINLTGSADSIAVDTANVYLAGGDGTVKKVPIGGGTPTTLASGGSGGPAYVAVDSASVYWTDPGTSPCQDCPLAGSVLKLTPK
jgi:hypothetical protein